MPRTGTPSSKISGGGRGQPASGTEAGPPDRITARGANSARKAGVTFWNGWISQIDVEFAQPAGDELRHLGAEIDDEQALVLGAMSIGARYAAVPRAEKGRPRASGVAFGPAGRKSPFARGATT